MPTLEEHQRAYGNAMRAGDTEAAAAIQKDLQQAAHAQALKQTAEDMSTGERALVNLGAGFDTAWQGFKQIAPGFKGPTDAELREKRERDAALAKATETGVGADWMPSAGTALQFAGETLPTVAIPGVGTAGNLAVKTARTVLPRATQATLALARGAGTGAAGGAAAGALAPVTSDESRAANVILGAAGGTVLPAAGLAWRTGKNVVSNMTKAGGRERAGTILREALGADADSVAMAADARERARRFQPQSVREIPETLAEASGSPAAARVESQARRAPETAGPWADLVEEQNAARFRAFMDATREHGSLDTRVASRDRATGPLRERALGAAGQDPWFHVPAVQAVERVAASPASANPAVEHVVDYVRNQLAGTKTAITPERLYEVRKVLDTKLHGPHVIGDNLSSAVKGADRQTLAIINGIDEALNAASGGKWDAYLTRYQNKSRPVNASRAAQDARAVFADPNIPTIGGAPEVTLNRLRAAQQAGTSNFDPRLTDFSPKAARTMDEISNQFVRAQEPARVRKLVGTQGGGSQTSTDIDAALGQLTKGSGAIASMVEFMTRGSSLAARTEVSRLLQNPREAVNAIRAAAMTGRPLSQAQQMLLEAASRTLGAGTAGLLSAQ